MATGRELLSAAIAAKGVLAVARVPGRHGQHAADETLVSPSEDCEPMQWCAPLRRQQAGRRDSSTVPVQPEAKAFAGTEAHTGPRPRTNENNMARVRRIRLYPIPDVRLFSVSQV